MGVSKNRGTPKSSILIGFSITNHPFWGTPLFGNIHIWVLILHQNHVQLDENFWHPKKPEARLSTCHLQVPHLQKDLPPKKGSKQSKRENTQYFHPLLCTCKKRTLNSLWPFLWWWKRWSLQRLELWKLPTFWDKVWATSPELSELGEGLLNGGSGFLWDESGGYTYLFTIKIQNLCG